MLDVTRLDPVQPLFTHKLFNSIPGDSSCSSFSSAVPIKSLLGAEEALEEDRSLPCQLTLVQKCAIEDLENLLFYCSKEYYQQLKEWSFSLAPLLTAHPLISMFSLHNPLLDKRIESRLRSLLRRDALIMRKYQWLLRTVELLGKLCIKWKLFDIAQVTHREEGLRSSSLLSLCAKVNESVFVADVLYLAATHTEPDTKLEASCLELASTVTRMLSETTMYLLSLNQKIDYRLHESIADFLYAGLGRVTPEQVAVVPHSSHIRVGSMEKMQHSRRVGFHVLERGSFLARCCTRNPVYAANEHLVRLLTALLRAYQRFEATIGAQII